MFKVSVVLLLLVTITPQLCIGEPMGIAAFRVGDPMVFEISYDGSVPGWDGIVAVGEKDGQPKLSFANSVMFVVTQGRQEFVPEPSDSTNVRRWWQTLSAKHGKLVQPIDNRVGNQAYNIALVDPFTTQLDLTQYYQLEGPGIYTIYWGIEGLWTEEIVFRVLTEKSDP